MSPSEEDESDYAEAEAPLLSTAVVSSLPSLPDEETLHYASSDVLSLPSLPSLPHIPRHRLRFLSKLGDGEFGQVHHCKLEGSDGQWNQVAVKSLRPESESGARMEFEKEIRVLGRLEHPNLVRLLATSEGRDGRMMVLELMDGGDLHSFLSTRGEILANAQLLSFAVQISGAVAYLHAQEHLHRDIASRNCLVSQDGRVVKLSNFSMARRLYASHYYRIRGAFALPIRWMAPESLLVGTFSKWTDVWAEGVLLWELWSRAEQPFQSLSDAAVVDNLQRGLPFGLERPPDCPEPLHALMASCWHLQPTQRPTASGIYHSLRAMAF